MKRRQILLALLPLLALGLLATLIRYTWSTFTNPSRSWLIAVAIDATSNVAGNGTWGQTISARAARARCDGRWWGRALCWLLNEVNPGHCDKALTDPNQNLTGNEADERSAGKAG